jgi:hypothetical protein
MDPLPDQPPSQPSPAPALGTDAQNLLRTATGPGQRGWIVLAVGREFGSCWAGGHQFLAGRDPAALDRWRAAIHELVAAGLVEPPKPGGWVYEVTVAGYELATRSA